MTPGATIEFQLKTVLTPIASRLYSAIKENPTDRIVTDCDGCKLQIQAGTGLKVDRPIIILQEVYDLRRVV